MKNNEIDVPEVGTDNLPLFKHKKRHKKPKNPEITLPGTNTGGVVTWERYPIGRNAEKKPNKKKVVKDYLDSKLSQFPENKSYPDLADIGLADSFSLL